MEGLIQTAEAFAPKRKPIPNLLRPSQVADNREELARLEATIQQPHTQDKAAMAAQIARLRHTLDTLSPRAYERGEVDAARAQERALREELVAGMLTHEEMRTNPPGATDHEVRWQRENKEKVLAWKHLRLRLAATDGDTGAEVANLERFRPQTRAGSLNTGMGQVARKAFVGLEAAGSGTVFSDEDKAALEATGPEGAEIAARLATLTNDQRALVKDFLTKLQAGEAPRKRGRPPKAKEAA